MVILSNLNIIMTLSHILFFFSKIILVIRQVQWSKQISFKHHISGKFNEGISGNNILQGLQKQIYSNNFNTNLLQSNIRLIPSCYLIAFWEDRILGCFKKHKMSWEGLLGNLYFFYKKGMLKQSFHHLLNKQGTEFGQIFNEE